MIFEIDDIGDESYIECCIVNNSDYLDGKIIVVGTEIKRKNEKVISGIVFKSRKAPSLGPPVGARRRTRS